jgi:hypothetical protein
MKISNIYINLKAVNISNMWISCLNLSNLMRTNVFELIKLNPKKLWIKTNSIEKFCLNVWMNILLKKSDI